MNRYNCEKLLDNTVRFIKDNLKNGIDTINNSNNDDFSIPLIKNSNYIFSYDNSTIEAFDSTFLLFTVDEVTDNQDVDEDSITCTVTFNLLYHIRNVSENELSIRQICRYDNAIRYIFNKLYRKNGRDKAIYNGIKFGEKTVNSLVDNNLENKSILQIAKPYFVSYSYL